MKITRIYAYQINLPLKESKYKMADQMVLTSFDSTVICIDTDAGITGYGEACPLGPVYLPAYGKGVRAGLAELGPGLIGEDPLQLWKLNRKMDALLKGHPYVKSGIDMACWDILGKATGQPVCTLLGGRYSDDVPLYRAITQEAPDAMAVHVKEYLDKGYHKFQLKVGGDPDEDIERIKAARAQLGPGDLLIADANTGWLMHEAMRVVRAVKDVNVYIEQPCMGYEQCVSVRRHTEHPFILDEVIDSLDMILRGYQDHAMDAINIKISKYGGLTKASQARDLGVSLGIAMTIEDSWGGDIITAAIAHLAQSTPPDFLLTTTDFNSYVTVSFADGAPKRVNGRMAASTAPGLGVTLKQEVLGDPVLTIE